MAPSAPKKERQGVTPDSKMTKERAMQLKGALINYAKKSNDAIKGMMNFHQNLVHFRSKMALFCSKFPVKIIIKSLDCCRKSKSYGRKSTCIPWRWFIRRGGTQATLPRFTRYDSFRWRYDYVIFQQCVTAQMNNYMTLNSNIQNRRRKKKIFKNVSVILNVSFQKLSFFETKITEFGFNFKNFGHFRDKLVKFGQKMVNFG